MKVELTSNDTGSIQELNLKTNDKILPNQIVAVIQTNNSKRVTITNPYEGKVIKLHVKPGDDVIEGMVLATVHVGN